VILVSTLEGERQLFRAKYPQELALLLERKSYRSRERDSSPGQNIHRSWLSCLSAGRALSRKDLPLPLRYGGGRLPSTEQKIPEFLKLRDLFR